MNDRHPDSDHRRKLSFGGLGLRIAIAAGLLVVAGLSAARIASASFEQLALPMGDVVSHDGMVMGTLRLTGDRLVFYSGDRFRSNEGNLAVNFANGSSLLLCPHSQLQVLAANQNSGVMLAFQEGGTQKPFPLRTADVVMTPDWRIQLTGDAHGDESGSLQISTSRRGELCLSSNVKAGNYFRVSQLIGDSVFDVSGQSSVKLVDGRILPSPGGCACEVASSGASAVPAPGVAPNPVTAANVSGPATTTMAQPAAPASATSGVVSAASSPVPTRPGRQRPQDVAGYMRSFIRLLFGR